MTVTASKYARAAGNHLMADVLKEKADTVYTSDIATYDRAHDSLYDFLKPHGVWPDVSAIITNPPYGKGNRDARLFAEYALTRCKGLVALLLTAKFDFGSTRKHLFANNARFAAKITLTDRISWTLDGVTGTEDHAWYVWTEKPRLPRSPVILYAGRSA